MRRLSPPDIALRLVAASLLSAAAGLAFGPSLLALARPLLEVVAELLLPGYAVGLAVGDETLRLTVTTIYSQALGAGNTLAPLTRFDPAIATVPHTLLPPVILVAALAAWPATGWRELAARALLAVPLALAVLLLTAPIHLAGLVDAALSELRGALTGAPQREPWTVTCMVFLEMGGRWLAPITLAAAAIFALAGGPFSPARTPRSRARSRGT